MIILLNYRRILYFCTIFAFYSGRSYCSTQDSYVDVTMPGFSPTEDEQYVCTAVEVPVSGYIIEFLPSATADRTHHMLAYTCDQPSGTPGTTWECGHGSMCNGEQNIIYAWARNAPPLTLPQNVGVPIGPDNKAKYVLLQMHYAKKFGGKVFDYSGVRLRIAPQQPQYLAGIYLFIPGGDIPANTQSVAVNASCDYNVNAVVHPFAFRPHTHHLGRIVSAYKYSKEGTWTKIGKGNPQWPQRFYPIESGVTINSGDVLAAQCIFNSTGRDHATNFGMHGHDEMCNFYMYYYVEAKYRNLMDQIHYCGGEAHKNLFDQYPTEASEPFAPNPEMDETATASEAGFAVVEQASWPRSNYSFGQIAGLAMDKKGNLVVFHRADRVWGNMTFDLANNYMEKTMGPITKETVITLANDGSVVSRWGNDFFYLPHGIFVDENDYVWTTDVAMQQVFKFDTKSTTMKPLLALGKLFEPGSDNDHFCKPSSVAVAAGEGTVFVADGYCNNRIMKFSKDGKFLASWGEASTGPLPSGYPKLGTFFLPHGLSLDDDRRRIFVADRENGRVQIFTYDGTPLSQLAERDQFGDTVYSVSYCPIYNTIFVVNGPAYTRTVDLRVFAFDGSTGRLMYAWKPRVGDFSMPHAILASKDCSHICVGEIGPNKLWRFEVTASGRRASNGDDQTKKPTGGVKEMHHGHNHKPDTANDGDHLNRLRSETENTLKLIVVLFIALAVPVLLIVGVCCCIRYRKGFNRQNLLENGFGRKGKNGLFSDRDRKGFQPLSTKDIDASDETDSEDEHTLYKAHMNFGTRKA